MLCVHPCTRALVPKCGLRVAHSARSLALGGPSAVACVSLCVCRKARCWLAVCPLTLVLCRRRHPGGGASGRCVRFVRVALAALGSQLHGVNGGLNTCDCRDSVSVRFSVGLVFRGGAARTLAVCFFGCSLPTPHVVPAWCAQLLLTDAAAYARRLRSIDRILRGTFLDGLCALSCFHRDLCRLRLLPVLVSSIVSTESGTRSSFEKKY